MTERGVILAAQDAQARSLINYFPPGLVSQPASFEIAAGVMHLEKLAQAACGRENRNIVVDLGGNDTTWLKLNEQNPGLCSIMESRGVKTVSAFTLGPRIDDLTLLNLTLEQGIQPSAMLLILNENHVPDGVAREEVYARTMQHSAFQRAIDLGAVRVWLPKMRYDDMLAIEAKRVLFRMAADGLVPADRKVNPIGPFARSRIRAWIEAFEREFWPVRSWLP